VCETERLPCTLHRNLTPSIEASLRTQPPIPRGAGSGLCACVKCRALWCHNRNPCPQNRRRCGWESFNRSVYVSVRIAAVYLACSAVACTETYGLRRRRLKRALRFWKFSFAHFFSKKKWAHSLPIASRGCSCCYFLWKKVTKELCGIGTHASIAAPRAVGFGA
jgi:hypothetical protein